MHNHEATHRDIESLKAIWILGSKGEMELMREANCPGITCRRHVPTAILI